MRKDIKLWDTIDVVEIKEIKNNLLRLHKFGYTSKSDSLILLDSSMILHSILRDGRPASKKIMDQIKKKKEAIAVPDFIYNECVDIAREKGYDLEFDFWINYYHVALLSGTQYKGVRNSDDIDDVLCGLGEREYRDMLDRFIDFAEPSPCDLAGICLGLNFQRRGINTTILSEDWHHNVENLQEAIIEIAEKKRQKNYLKLRDCKNLYSNI